MSDPFVKRSLDYIFERGLHGVRETAPRAYLRGIDVLKDDLVPALNRSVSVFKRLNGHYPDLINPGSFTQKQLLFKFFAPIPIYSPSDKLGSRAYLPDIYKNKIKVPETKWSSRRPELPANGALPSGRYWFKSNHSSGRNKALDFPLDDTQRAALLTDATTWLTKIHDRRLALWWYEIFDRVIYLEEDLSEGGISANDYKFFVCNGRVIIYQYDSDRFGQHDQTIYDRDGKLLDQTLYYKGSNPTPPPAQLPLMVEVAEAIGKSFDFMRVDFFVRGGQVYLGELGLVPNGCSIPIRSPFLDHRLGERWFAPWFGYNARQNWAYYETTRARHLFDQGAGTVPDTSAIWKNKVLDQSEQVEAVDG